MPEFDCPQPVPVGVKLSSGSLDVVAEARDTASVTVTPWDTSDGSRDAAARTTVELRDGRLLVETRDGGALWLLVDGRVRIHGASGDVTVTRAGGEVSGGTASGDLTVEEAAGSVRATTASGDLRLGCVRGGTVNLKTASGDVSVGVARGTSVWLDVSTVSGRTRNDLSMNGAAPTDGDPRLSLTVRTASGDVDIRRVAVPAAA